MAQDDRHGGTGFHTHVGWGCWGKGMLVLLHQGILPAQFFNSGHTGPTCRQTMRAEPLEDCTGLGKPSTERSGRYVAVAHCVLRLGEIVLPVRCLQVRCRI